MASLTLKNMPDELLERIRDLAERKRRSMTQQVLYMLEQALAAAQEDVDDLNAKKPADVGNQQK